VLELDWACAYNPDKYKKGSRQMLFALFYVISIIILILHFTGTLARWRLEWLIYVLAVAVFPAVIYL